MVEIKRKIIPNRMSILKDKEKIIKFMDFVTDSFLLFDQNLNLIGLNKIALKRWGVKKEDVLGKHILRLTPPPSHEDVLLRYRQYKKVLKTGKPLITHEPVLHTHFGRRYIILRVFKFGGGLAMLVTDITESEQAEKALKESERRFRTIFDDARDGILVADLKTKQFVMANRAMCRMLGYTKEELMHLGVKDIHPKKDLKYVIEQFEKLGREEIKIAPDLRVKRKDGSVFYADISRTLVTLGGRKYLMGNFRDITERKKAEEDLRQREEEFRIIFENAKDAIFWAEPETGLIINCNKAAELLLERKKSQIIGYKQTRLHPARKAKEYMRMFKRHIRQKGAVDDEAEVITSSRRIKTVHITATVTKIGERPILQGIFRDITERRIAAEKLRESEERFRHLVRAAGNIILCLSEDFRITEFNAEAEKLYGRKRREVLGKNYLKLFLPATEQKVVASAIKRVFMGEQSRGFENDIITSSGQRRIISWNVNPLPKINGKVPGIIAVGEDITEVKRLEQAKANLIRNISHGLKTPLALSKMSCDILKEGIVKNDIALIKRAQVIGEKNLNKLQKDTKDILDIFSSELKKVVKHGKRKLSLKKTIEKIILNLKLLIREKRDKIKIDIARGADKIIMSLTDLEFLLSNLIENAVKFTEKGYIYIKSRVINKHICITVKDTGRGIKITEGDWLFTKFYKVPPAITSAGAGLVICKEIVDTYKGTIKMDSEGEGKGTTVVIRLPIK